MTLAADGGRTSAAAEVKIQMSVFSVIANGTRILIVFLLCSVFWIHELAMCTTTLFILLLQQRPVQLEL